MCLDFDFVPTHLLTVGCVYRAACADSLNAAATPLFGSIIPVRIGNSNSKQLFENVQCGAWAQFRNVLCEVRPSVKGDHMLSVLYRDISKIAITGTHDAGVSRILRCVLWRVAAL
jgi:hypothetical protein